MKREIICEKAMFKRAGWKDYPNEHRTHKTGIAKNNYLCDSCVPLHEIKKGDKCIAYSTWADFHSNPYYEWETEFINT
jgi:hypothetical protein